MIFKDYLSKAWNLHATEPQKVLDGFKDNFKIIESDSDVLSMANIIVHVAGEHLGKWGEGLTLLKELKQNSLLRDMDSFNRSIAILNLGANPDFAFNHYKPSDQARILAITSSALASQNDLSRAAKYLTMAKEITENELEKEDPANKSLGITGWNLACALEEKENLTKEEIDLMKLSAHVSRKFWEIAGTWKEVERGEYRLANTYLKAGEPDQALIHAKNCVAIVEANNNEPIEAFFGYEVLALVEKTRKEFKGFELAKNKMTEAFDRLSEDDKSWCKATLDKLI